MSNFSFLKMFSEVICGKSVWRWVRVKSYHILYYSWIWMHLKRRISKMKIFSFFHFHCDVQGIHCHKQGYQTVNDSSDVPIFWLFQPITKVDTFWCIAAFAADNFRKHFGKREICSRRLCRRQLSKTLCGKRRSFQLYSITIISFINSEFLYSWLNHFQSHLLHMCSMSERVAQEPSYQIRCSDNKHSS